MRRLEGRALLLLLAIAGALWAFFSLAGEMTEGETDGFDRGLLLALRNPADLSDPIGSRSFEEAMRDITALGGFTVLTLVTVVAVLVFLFHGRRRHALVMGGAVLLANFTSEALKDVYARARPDLVPHGSYVYSHSFPSGHSMLSAATYLTLAMLIASVEGRRSTKILIYVLAVALILAVGFSRVYLGVHWPSDVLAGWSLGAAWSFLAWVLLLSLGGKPVQPRA
ncbi:MAG: phosphatase PAP2 family protein [Phenylobacterium sp.]